MSGDYILGLSLMGHFGRFFVNLFSKDNSKLFLNALTLPLLEQL